MVTDRHELQCAQFRPKHRKHVDSFLLPLPAETLQVPSLDTKLPSVEGLEFVDLSSDESMENLIARLDVDRSVSRVTSYKGGYTEARKRLERFCGEGLVNYERDRNWVGRDGGSRLSPWLHFGHLTPLEAVFTAQDFAQRFPIPKPCLDKFVEQIMNRREYCINVVYFCPDGYDRLEKMAPPWALASFAKHAKDKRPYIYSLEELERAETGDKYWNAAQLELLHTGFMHGYMRMYWAKKIMEWSPNMETAFEHCLYLNDKYQLDGRDPNSYPAIAWCFGHSDKPSGQERPIFGKVSIMTASALQRKYGDTVGAYVARANQLHSPKGEAELSQDMKKAIQRKVPKLGPTPSDYD